MPRKPRPIISLTTDFGLRDHYVAAMKAVLVSHCPEAILIDVTHDVPRHDVLCGSICLERVVAGFPDGTVHLAVVDPGVGTERKILVAQINKQIVVCPDNGLITWAWHRLGPGKAYELQWRPPRSSATFHGRDVMAPVAARLAAGESVPSMARPMRNPILLDIAPALNRKGSVIHLDHFGNATTNISHETLKSFQVKNVRVRGQRLGMLKHTYWDAAPGEPLALIGSSGLLEIAVRDGDAARQLKLKIGDEVQVQ